MSDWFERFGRAEVADGLVIGAFPLDRGDVAALRDEGVTRVVSLCEDAEYEPGERQALSFLYGEVAVTEERVPSMDHGNLLPGALERASEIVLGHLAAGERVYLHCRAGWQRSATVAAAVVARRDGVGVDEALGMIRKAKPSADPLPHQIEDLRRWFALRTAADE